MTEADTKVADEPTIEQTKPKRERSEEQNESWNRREKSLGGEESGS